MFMPKFRDLVRCAATVEGTAPVALGAAPAGFTHFADALGVGDQFYYMIENLDRPAEREVGRGTLSDAGTVAREAVSGTLTAFSEGTKSIALVAAAEYHDGADAGEVRRGASVLPATPRSLFEAAAPVELPRTAIVTADFSAGINFNLTLTGDSLLGDPANVKPGQSGRIRVTQDVTGGRALTFGPRWQFAGGPPTLSLTAGAVDVIAYFVNSDGGVEASVASGLKVRPIPLSVSDFKNGLYRLGSTPVALDQMWVPDPSITTFQPGSVVPGVGWQTVSNTTTPNGMVAAPAHLAALGSLDEGITIVVDHLLVQPGGTKPRIVIDVARLPDWQSGWAYYQNGTSYVALYDYAGLYQRVPEPAPVGEARTAITLGPDRLVYSRNGGALQKTSVNPARASGANYIGLFPYTSHDDPSPSTARIMRATIYRAQPDALLRELSA